MNKAVGFPESKIEDRHFSEFEKTRSQLGESEATLQSFFDSAPMMMGIVELTDDDIFHIQDNAKSIGFFGSLYFKAAEKRASRMGATQAVIANWIKNYQEAKEKNTPVRFQYWQTTEAGPRYFSAAVSYIGESSTQRSRYSYIIEDITHQKQIEDQLREAQAELENRVRSRTAELAKTQSEAALHSARLKAVVENFPIGIAIANAQGDLEYMNPQGVSIWEGISKVPMEKYHEYRAWFVGTGKRVRNEDWALTIALKEEKTTVSQKLRIKSFTGKEKYILNSAGPVIGENGELLGAVAALQDITQSMRDEVILQEKTDQLALAVRSARLGFFDWEITRNKIVFSEQMQKDWGIGPDLTISTLEDAVKLIHPEDRDRVSDLIYDAIKNKSFYQTQYRVVHPSGKTVWLDVSGMIYYGTDGQPERFFGTSIDITELKTAQDQSRLALERSEIKFRTFAEAMPQMAFIADAQGNITYYNERHYSYFGVPRENEEGWKWAEQQIIHPDDLPSTIEAWKKSLRTGHLYELEYRLRRFDGQYRWHLARAVAVRDPEGKITRWVGTNTDIHDQKTYRDELQAALQARDEFLSIASHELKTPVTSLKLQVQLAKRNRERKDPLAYSPLKVDKFVNLVERQVERIIRLVDDMLDIGRIRAGKLTIQKEMVNLTELFKDVLDRLKLNFLEADTPVKWNLDESIQAYCDRLRIEQVLVNLLTNAMRYGEKKPIFVSMTKLSSENRVHIKVEDQGIGISSDSQERIFDRFERAVNANEVSGMGLGLFITKQIVAAHDGKIWVSSEGQGKGATFYVEFPLSAKSSE